MMQAPLSSASARPEKLRRALTTPLLTLYGLGVTVGAGIYVLVGTTAAEAGAYAPVSFVIAAIVVALMGLIALWGISQSVKVAATIMVIEIGGLIFVSVWGFGFADPLGAGFTEMIPPIAGPHWIGIGAASLLAFFAFVGFEDMANVTEEVKDPVGTMPKAIVLTLLIASLLYVATTTAVLFVVPVETLADAAAPLSTVCTNAPVSIERSFAIIAIVATVNGVLIQMIMASRVLYGLADRGYLPAVLATVWQRTQTPVVATLVVVCIILLLTLALPIDALAERTSQIVLFVFVLVNGALIRLKLVVQSETEHFNVPTIVPVLGLLTSVLLFGTAWL